MAELEDVTLDGKPLHSLRVADLKAALEKRGLSKSGQKNALVKRLKGALMLENLQRTSTPHIGLQPNSQIGEEMSQNSIIKQYLAKQQELLRQRLEREAREAAEANEMDSQAAPQEDHEEGKLVSCPVEQAPSLSCALFSQEGGGGELEPAVVRAGEDVETGVPSAVLSRSGTRRSLIQQAPDRQMETSQDPGSQEALDVGGRTRRSSSSRLSHEEPPRAVASLSVRVLGEPEKEGPATAASASTLQFSHSAQATSLGQEESEDDDKSDADEEWSVGGVKKGPKQGPASSSLPPQRERSRRKQQPPQHIPPPQLPHQPQLQLRQPTPPPSPPPEHSFPLPDTPKQSPPNEPEGAGAAEGMAASPSALQRQDSSSGSSSSGSSSPEPRHQRRPGPLTLLARKMESEGAFAGTRGRSELEVEGHGSKSAPICTAAVSPTTVFPTIIQQETGVSSISHGTNVGLPLLSPTGDPVPQGGNGMTSFEATAITSLAQGMETGNLLSTPRQLPLAESIDIGAIGDEQTEGGESSRPKEDLENEIMAVEQGKPEEEGKRELGERAEESCFSPGRQIEVESAALEKAAEPLESQPPSAVSTQPPSKKLRFLRDMPVSSVPASASPPGKQARLSSDEPPGGQPVEHLPSPAAAEQDKDETCEASRSPVGETGIVSKPQAAEAVAACSESETTEAEIGPGGSAGQADAKMLKVAEEGNSWKGAAVEAPVGPVLPPSPPPEEGDTEQERERQSSPSSDSSDSDSESSSSHSSGSSASPVQHGSKPSDKMSEGTKDSKANSQPEASADTPGTPCLKRKGEQLEEHDTGGVNQDKKPCLRDEKRRKMENEGLEGDSRIPARELKQAAMSEPADSAVQVEAPSESEGTGVQSRSDGRGATESRSEESTTPKAFTARKISLNTANKPSPASLGGSTPAAPSPGGLVEPESGGQAARKRRWGSSTAVTAKKPSISITTDSLKSLIPDIKPATGPGSQEAVVELHPDEGHLSGDEEGAERGEQGDQGLEKGLKIRRTVTQVVPAENQENGQKDREEEEEEEEQPESGRTITEEVKDGSSEVSMETQASSIREADLKKVIPSDSLVRRSISQQKSGVSITIDDPVRSNKQPSPPRGKITNIVHICNLVRPFTLGQLKELLNRTGTVVEEGFWIDKIKSHCYVTYSSTEEAVATRAALHGVKWPQSNPKFLSVDFAEQDELDFHRGLLTVERSGDEERSVPPSTPTGPSGRPGTLPPLLPERQRERASGGVRDQWAEREREMERRERTRAEREWDRDKVREFSKPREEREGGMRRSRSRDRERRRKERGKSKERKTEKKEKAPEEPPAKLLDDLFCKTKTAPCIYWLPLTEEQAAQREAERAERMKEREKQRKKLLEEEDKKREEERKERIKNRDKEGGGLPSTGAGGASRSAEGERERDRARDREGDKRRDAHRSRGGESKPGGSSAGGLGGGRRSRSRSNPSVRERRR